MPAKILPFVALLLLAGCSSVPSLLYKIEIQQGNVITREMVDKLKPGMTRSQVRFVLGSPLINDPFHSNRWDYVYRLEKRGRLVEQRELTVFFDGDVLTNIEGTYAPPPAFARSQPDEETGSAPSDRSSQEENSTPLSSDDRQSFPEIVQPSPQVALPPPPAESAAPGVDPDAADDPGSVLPPAYASPSSEIQEAGDAPANAGPILKEPDQSNQSRARVPSQSGDIGDKDADLPKD